MQIYDFFFEFCIIIGIETPEKDIAGQCRDAITVPGKTERI